MNLDDLGNDPLPDAESPEVEAFLESLDGLLDDERYQWAAKTLEGIRETVRGTRVITSGQHTAVTNISFLAHAGKAVWSRRYEGMDRGRR